MAHLKCTHNRRVVVLANGKQIHRNGDGSRCTERISFDGMAVHVDHNGNLALKTLKKEN